MFLTERFGTPFTRGFYSSRDNIQTLSAAYMERARYWLRECEAKHSECRAHKPNFIPTRLVHVGTWDSPIPVLLEMSTGFGSICQERRYCSLSHRWVEAELELKTTNMDDLVQEIPMQYLSKAARDAILVTRNLGVKYLWIDSLCIIQDSEDDWMKEAALMADIYENSVCTIAAAGEATVSDEAAFAAQNRLIYNVCRLAGSSNNGVYVLGNTTPGFNGYGLEGTNESSLVQHSDLLSRGWVYQERMLSPKMIFFGDREVLWSCRYGRASEEDPDGVPTMEIFGPLVSAEQMNANRDIISVISNFEKLRRGDFLIPEVNDAYGLHRYSSLWYTLVSDYSSCKLSREEGRLIAFSGLAQRIQSKTGWQYLAGLWRQTLFYDLLWYRTKEVGRRGASYIAPTWSWASVTGTVELYCSIPLWSETRFEENTPRPLIDVIGAETETYPLDTTRTGKVTNGKLVVRGYLSGPLLNDSIWTENKVVFEFSRCFQVNLWLDVVFCELGDILFMPLYGAIFENSIPDVGARGAGLGLIPKTNYYERVGFFSISIIRSPRKPLPQCLKLGEKETIIIV